MNRSRVWLPCLALAAVLLPPAVPRGAAEEPVSSVVWRPTAVMLPFNALWGLSSFPDGTVVAYATQPVPPVATAAKLLTSTDFGLTWSVTAPTIVGRPDMYLMALSMGTPRRGFAVFAPDTSDVNSGGIAVTDDGGRTFRPLGPLPPAGRGERFYVWRLRTLPGGRSAVAVGIVFNEVLRTFTSTEVLWIGDWGRTVRRAKLNLSPANVDDSHPGGLAIRDDSTAVVTTHAPDAFSPPVAGPGLGQTWSTTVWITRDAGRTWRKGAHLPQSEVLSLDFAAPDTLYASDWRHGTISRSRDAGRTFVPVGAIRPYPPPNDDRFYPPAADIDFVNRFVGYATTCLGGQWRTTDGGRTWVEEPSPNHGNVYLTPHCFATSVSAPDIEHAVSGWSQGMLTRVVVSTP